MNMSTLAPDRNREFYGRGYIAGETPGIVTVGGAPAARKVRIFHRNPFKLLAAFPSNPDGTYRFDFLRQDATYVVIGVDHNLFYNAVIQDNITPAPMDP